MGTTTQTDAPSSAPSTGRIAPQVPATSEDLMMYASQLAAIKHDAESLVSGLSNDQLNWQPSPTSWSIAQCLDHLVLSADGFLHEQRRAIEHGRIRSMVSDGPYRHGWLGTKLLGGIEPPVTRKFRAPKGAVPASNYDRDELLAEFLKRQERFGDAIRAARGLDLGRISVRIPGIPLVKTSLGQSFTFALAHERRHLWQARRVREDPRFPAN